MCLSRRTRTQRRPGNFDRFKEADILNKRSSILAPLLDGTAMYRLAVPPAGERETLGPPQSIDYAGDVANVIRKIYARMKQELVRK